MILVSCCNDNGGIYGIDEETLEPTQVIHHEARGLAVENGFLFVANRRGLRLYRKKSFFIWDQVAKYNDNQNWHGLAIKDAIVYSAVSHNHRIMCFDKLLNPYKPEKYEWPEGYPNDLCFFNDQLYYCLPRIGKVMKWPEPKPLFEDLQMPHSLVVTDEHIYTCNSAIGEVIRFNRDEHSKHAEGKHELILKVPEYARGLYLDGNDLWIGLSKHRRNEDPKWRCGVIRKNLSSGVEKFIALPSDEVYDIVKM